MIYIVDDDDSVRSSLVRLMGSAGLAASAFATAEGFLRDAPPQADGGDDGAVVIIDMHLSGMSGLELQRELLRLGRNVPVVLTTALDDPGMRRAASSAGALGLLVKPFGDAVLLDLVQRALRGERSTVEVE